VACDIEAAQLGGKVTPRRHGKLPPSWREGWKGFFDDFLKVRAADSAQPLRVEEPRRVATLGYSRTQPRRFAPRAADRSCGANPGD
jgi:hypothetical protein